MTAGAPCEICERIRGFTPDSPYFIAELETGYAVLADNQYYRGYSIFLAKQCVPELHDLQHDVRSSFLREMALVAETVFRTFEPRKLNYELLGNSVPHLHWHLFPRYADDAKPQWPVWSNPAFLEASRDTAGAASDLRTMRDLMRASLTALRDA